jgi:hypothetical protein
MVTTRQRYWFYIVFAWRRADWLRQHHSEIDILQANGAITSVDGDINLMPLVHSAWLRSPLNISQGNLPKVN